MYGAQHFLCQLFSSLCPLLLGYYRGRRDYYQSDSGGRSDGGDGRRGGREEATTGVMVVVEGEEATTGVIMVVEGEEAMEGATTNPAAAKPTSFKYDSDFD